MIVKLHDDFFARIKEGIQNDWGRFHKIMSDKWVAQEEARVKQEHAKALADRKAREAMLFPGVKNKKSPYLDP